MLKKSDNMIADTVFRRSAMRASMCLEHGGPDRTPCSDPAPASRCRYRKHHYCRWLGLSRHNLIAPATMMQVLQYMPNTTMNLTLSPCCRWRAMTLFAVPCRSASGGRGWKSLSETGSLQGVYNLAGFITTASGHEWRLCNIFLAMQ